MYTIFTHYLAFSHLSFSFWNAGDAARAAAVTSATSFGSAWKKARTRKTAAAKKLGVTKAGAAADQP